MRAGSASGSFPTFFTLILLAFSAAHLRAADSGSPALLARKIPLVDKYDHIQGISLMLYDLRRTDRIEWRLYPDTFFTPAEQRGASDLQYWQGADILAVHWASGGTDMNSILFYTCDDAAGLTYLGRLNPTDFGAEWWDASTLDVRFSGRNVYIHGISSPTQEFIIKATVGEDGTFVIREKHFTFDDPPILPVVKNSGVFTGSAVGLWDILAWHDFDFADAAREIADTAARLDPKGTVEAPIYYQFMAGVMIIYGKQGQNPSIWDPHQGVLFEKAHSFDVYWDKMKAVGSVLIVQPPFRGEEYIETYDISTPTSPRLLKRFSINDVPNINLKDCRIFGDNLAYAGTDGYVIRIKVSPDGSLTPLHHPIELFEAVDNGDLDAVQGLADWQIDSISSRNPMHESAVTYAIYRHEYGALEEMAKVEMEHDRRGSDNPLLQAIAMKDPKAVATVLDAFPGLLSAGSGRTGPLGAAVGTGDVVMVQTLCDAGAKLEIDAQEGGLPVNLVSFAKTEEMKAFLTRRGVPKEIRLTKPQSAFARTEGYRLRSTALSDAKVVTSTKQNEEVQVLAVTAAYQTLNGQTSRWLLVRTAKGLQGWVFGAFFYIR